MSMNDFCVNPLRFQDSMRASQRWRLTSLLVNPISIMYPQHVDERWDHLDEGSQGFIEVVRQTLTIRLAKRES